MKKKIFNATIGGVYIVSAVLGLVMALTVCMMECDAWYCAYENYAILERETERQYGERYGGEWNEEKSQAWKEMDERYDELKKFQMYIPLYWTWSELYDIGGRLSIPDDRYNYMPFVLMGSAMLTVLLSMLLMEGKAINKAWRQKMLQAVAIMVLIILPFVAWQCAEWRMLGKWMRYYSMRVYGTITTWHVLAPVLLMFIPLNALKKLRVRKTKGNDERTGGPEYIDGDYVMPAKPVAEKKVIGDMGGMMPETAIAAEINDTEGK